VRDAEAIQRNFYKLKYLPKPAVMVDILENFCNSLEFQFEIHTFMHFETQLKWADKTQFAGTRQIWV
jgi:hypothetical protein